MAEYPLAAVKRVLKRTRLRASDEAVIEFENVIEEVTADLAAEAVANAKSRGKKTVEVRDITAAKRALQLI